MGTGGMRWGAGRPAWHVKAEHCRKIDARRWARERILQVGRSGGWAWTDPETGEQTASIGYASDGHAVTLMFNVNDEPVRQRVPILSTDCNFGGRRFWFGCPRCGERVANLFLRHAGFACRTCNRIVYASQSEDACGRSWRKQVKIEQRLEDDWQRPKGMRHATYERLLKVLEDCEATRDAALTGMLARLGWPG